MEKACTGDEPVGRLQMMQEYGVKVDTTIISSKCFGEYLIETMGRGNPFNWYSCRWENGIDPCDPETALQQSEPPS